MRYENKKAISYRGYFYIVEFIVFKAGQLTLKGTSKRNYRSIWDMLPVGKSQRAR
jgi:hypothetical protein